MTQPTIDPELLLADLDALAQIGMDPQGGVTRIAYGAADIQARAWIERQLRGLGLEVITDPIGNTIARYGTSSLPAILIGSHTDTVAQGGRFDGSLGVLAGLACLRALVEHGTPTRHPIELVNFMAEEATVYGTLGSRAMVSQLEPADLELPAFDGRSVADHLRAAGFDPAQAHTAARAPGTVAAYLELHIEQGDQLASERIPIGLVEGIVGIRRYQVRFAGQANHAGTTPMLRRRDALIAAARFVLAVQERAAAAGIVGTTGTLAIAPNVPNVIPGQATLTCEIRGMDDATLDQVAAELHADAQSWHGTMTPISAKSPVASDLQLLTILAQCCQQLELPFCQLPSGAGHDAMNMAALAPQAMIFIPSQAGISHAPEEYSDDSDCVAGARLLLAAILALDAAL